MPVRHERALGTGYVPQDLALVVAQEPSLLLSAFARVGGDEPTQRLLAYSVDDVGGLSPGADLSDAIDTLLMYLPGCVDFSTAYADGYVIVYEGYDAFGCALKLSAATADGSRDDWLSLPPGQGDHSGGHVSSCEADVCTWGDRLLLSARGEEVWVSSCALSAWGDWVPAVVVSRGCRPSLASKASEAYLAVTDAEADPPEYRQAPRPGPILLCRSEDGSTWSEPMPTVDEPKAHSSALAADDDIGLVLVYTAEREDGWPLFAARSADFGETWGEPVMLTEPTAHAFRPDAMLHDGILYVAYLVLPDEPARDDDMGMLKDPVGARALTLDPKELPVP